MPPALVFKLIDLLEDHIKAQDSSYIPIHFQVLATPRFFAEGSYQKGTSQDYKHPMGQSIFCRVLHRLVTALSLIAHEWIRFPQTKQERQQVKNQ